MCSYFYHFPKELEVVYNQNIVPLRSNTIGVRQNYKWANHIKVVKCAVCAEISSWDRHYQCSLCPRLPAAGQRAKSGGLSAKRVHPPPRGGRPQPITFTRPRLETMETGPRI